MQKRVTIMDVAAHCGVSYQTVSRVINGHPNVADSTRSRVLKAIEKLNYHPNKAAQSLATGRSKMLAVIAFNIDYYGPNQMLVNIEKAARAAGYDLIISNINQPSVRDVQKTLGDVRRWQVEGILIIATVSGIALKDMIATSAIPIVQIDAGKDANCPVVAVDQKAGCRQITQYLIDLGHRDIFEVSGPLDWYGAQERHSGWTETMAINGLDTNNWTAGNWSARSGYDCIQKLMASGASFTGLVMGNDQMAMGAIRALAEAQLRIPDDVSVVGFDDIPEAEFSVPPLTTIRQDFVVLGEAGINMLLRHVSDRKLPAEHLLIQPTLIERASAQRCLSGDKA